MKNDVRTSSTGRKSRDDTARTIRSSEKSSPESSAFTVVFADDGKNGLAGPAPSWSIDAGTTSGLTMRCAWRRLSSWRYGGDGGNRRRQHDEHDGDSDGCLHLRARCGARATPATRPTRAAELRPRPTSRCASAAATSSAWWRQEIPGPCPRWQRPPAAPR